jgi:GTP-binding protein
VFKVAIIGRENVGKSTIFNTLCGRNFSIVNDTAGITRDYVKHTAKLRDLFFEIIDTAGWYLSKNKKVLSEEILDNTLVAVNEADIILFVVDAKVAISNEDLLYAKQVLKMNKKVILLANKAEGKTFLSESDLLKLGFGAGIFISAEHKRGYDDIYNVLSELISDKFEDRKIEENFISIAIVGRPNVGKSTLFNKILGFERSLVSDIAGTTRDHIIYKISIDNYTINLYDTAGVRKRAKIDDSVEKLSVTKSISAIKHSDIVLLILDSQSAFEKQDFTVANLALKHNKLLIPIINKKDLISNIKEYKEELDYIISKKLPFLQDNEIIYTSINNSLNVTKLFKSVFKLWEKNNSRISTGQLNTWLVKLLKNYNLPRIKDKVKLKIKYIKQSDTCPLTFSCFTNISGPLNCVNFEKFLINSLRKDFSLEGVSIKLKFISSKNPYI